MKPRRNGAGAARRQTGTHLAISLPLYGAVPPRFGSWCPARSTISPPNLITAACVHAGPRAAKPTEGCLGGKDLLGQRVRGRQGSSQQGGPMQKLSPGDVCRARSWMLLAPGPTACPCPWWGQADTASAVWLRRLSSSAAVFVSIVLMVCGVIAKGTLPSLSSRFS